MKLVTSPDYDSLNVLKLLQETFQSEDTLSLLIPLLKIEDRPSAKNKLHECLILILNLSTI